MPTERMQRQIDSLLDETESAASDRDWQRVLDLAERVLAIDPSNDDARGFVAMAGGLSVADQPTAATVTGAAPPPTSFAAGRYEVRDHLGDGATKRVFLAHDTLLDRDVAFALVRTEGLDEDRRLRVRREAQAMGRLGDHPNIVTVFDVGQEDDGTPYIVSQYMAGGDVRSLLEASEGPLPLEQTLGIAKAICEGLSFGHSRSVVHRDLKPGNVLLTDDGTAKVGDFGVAVALDRTRLTRDAQMQGTALYMPPEIALGGEVTPRADLYSLGVLLYELVTGKPPFVGDDPVAVISQHISTPPVAPSWHTEHCPPDLEELILRLLQKAPDERPESAAEVAETLGRVDPEAKSASHSDSGSNPLDRLARGVFVGREQELSRLRDAFDQAFAGRGSGVMLVCEPGIGKTRTVQELETYAQMRGANTLWGRSHEASGAPAYWPWIQIGNANARLMPPAELAGEIEPAQTSELTRIFPVLLELPNVSEPMPVTDPDAARFRLFDAYAAFIRAASARTPTVLVVDDLHWADKPTLLLMQHLARELSSMRLLLVGTFRDTELDRTHPLSEVLGELTRDPGYERVVLRGGDRGQLVLHVRGREAAGAGEQAVGRLTDRPCDPRWRPGGDREAAQLAVRGGQRPAHHHCGGWPRLSL
jgi:hypothetical protein